MLINFIAKSICKGTNNRPEKRVRNGQKNSTAFQKPEQANTLHTSSVFLTKMHLNVVPHLKTL